MSDDDSSTSVSLKISSLNVRDFFHQTASNSEAKNKTDFVMQLRKRKVIKAFNDNMSVSDDQKSSGTFEGGERGSACQIRAERNKKRGYNNAAEEAIIRGDLIRLKSMACRNEADALFK